jgi:hypothetical protein
VVAILVVAFTDGLFSRATADPAVLAPQWAPMFGWMAGFAGTGFALMYVAVSAAGVKGLWNSVNRTKLVVAATAGIIVAAGAVFGALYKAPSPLDTVPWALAIWIAIGVVWSVVVTKRESRTPQPPAGLPVMSDESK